MIIAGIITSTIMAIILAISLWKAKDNNDKIGGLVVGVAWFILVIYGYSEQAEFRYQQGQIDALTGKIEYHLVTKSDSTRVWEKIEEDK